MFVVVCVCRAMAERGNALGRDKQAQFKLVLVGKWRARIGGREGWREGGREREEEVVQVVREKRVVILIYNGTLFPLSLPPSLFS